MQKQYIVGFPSETTNLYQKHNLWFVTLNCWRLVPSEPNCLPSNRKPKKALERPCIGQIWMLRVLLFNQQQVLTSDRWKASQVINTSA